MHSHILTLTHFHIFTFSHWHILTFLHWHIRTIVRLILYSLYISLDDVLGEKPGQFFPRQYGVGLELCRLCIAEQGSAELVPFGGVFNGIEVGGAYQKLSFSDAELEDDTQFVVPFDVINDLHYGAVCLVCVVQYHRTRIPGDAPPLPVTMLFGREVAE